MRDCFQVGGSHAAGVPAQVVDLPAFGDLTDEELVHDDVDTDLTANEEDGRITLGDVTPRPFPTIVTDQHLIEEPVKERAIHRSGLSLTSGMRPVAIGS